ncbi:50S ribosomal protein L25/general stress protein Ctc [uncultured Alistipes sp.]|uniref:50S ribosomal protein L25/general stress protein Ctc n=1 Tax=uncultured Alistipes sp. TaxID=538949 RepID=UPI00262557AA|nr:50S ribosomal protein L25/general stress protein Ctc [uncultured Alistipes sp.]
METIKIAGVKRDAFGKKETKAIRKTGQVPCVIYGNGTTVHFSVDARSLKPLIYTPQSYLVEFDIEGKTEMGVMREVQYHPVTDQILHVDFYHIVPGKPIAIDVPVKLTGNSEGVKQGGKLILSKRKIRISATMENLPDSIEVDVTSLGLGKSIFVGDLQFDNVAILTPATTAICAVKMTRAARGAAAAAEAAKK